MPRQTYRDSRGRFRRKTYRDTLAQLASCIGILAAIFAAILS